MYDVVIIGAGPIGLFSAFYCGLQNLNVVVLEYSDQVGGQLNTYLEKPIVDLPAIKKITAKELLKNLKEQLEIFQNKITIELNSVISSITKLENKTFLVQTEKEIIATKTILLCAGNGAYSYRKLDIENNDLVNILYKIENLNDFKNKRVTVLGGGDSAIDWAIMLLGVASEVNLIHRRENFRAHEHNVEKLKKSKANIFTPYDVKMVNKKSLTISNKQTQEQLILEHDYVLVNYGLIPKSGQWQNWHLEVTATGSVKVDTNQQTNIEGFYAAGDVCYYNGKIKTLCNGFGEVPVAVNSILKIINPEKNISINFGKL